MTQKEAELELLNERTDRIEEWVGVMPYDYWFKIATAERMARRQAEAERDEARREVEAADRDYTALDFKLAETERDVAAAQTVSASLAVEIDRLDAEVERLNTLAENRLRGMEAKGKVITELTTIAVQAREKALEEAARIVDAERHGGGCNCQYCDRDRKLGAMIRQRKSGGE